MCRKLTKWEESDARSMAILSDHWWTADSGIRLHRQHDTAERKTLTGWSSRISNLLHYNPSRRSWASKRTNEALVMSFYWWHYPQRLPHELYNRRNAEAEGSSLWKMPTAWRLLVSVPCRDMDWVCWIQPNRRGVAVKAPSSEIFETLVLTRWRTFLLQPAGIEFFGVIVAWTKN